MADKTGASIQKKTTEAEDVPAELFIPATDYGIVEEKAKSSESKSKTQKASKKTEHTQMDLEDYLRVFSFQTN